MQSDNSNPTNLLVCHLIQANTQYNLLKSNHFYPTFPYDIFYETFLISIIIFTVFYNDRQLPEEEVVSLNIFLNKVKQSKQSV